ncbi:acyl-CoA N-acyltransferase [Ophiobolus disseminans]|uniref:Acyl-CoA N-acyltransferase n=1 Tax=Ophiobolus disseminans TaxID=1469910 RepID=A0A6A6ZCL3_9PLEO|nr:acyl-CoA N-acyltransferase [Ophiobolus disseminans]
MLIRLATPQDEPAIAALCAAAFFNEHLFGVTIHPHRHAYPADKQIFWRQWLREDLSTPCARVIVSTTLENGQEIITGMATWQRQGSDPYAQAVKNEWINPGAFPPLESTHNRAMDPTRASILQDSEPYFKHFWNATTNGVPRLENWYLHLCCIHPSHQKRGYGQQLVSWGLERARNEGVHASVMASDGADAFYLRYGFDECVGNCCQGEGNPLGVAGVRGGDVLFMWAKTESKGTTETDLALS